MKNLVTLLPFMDSQEIKELAIKVVTGETKGIKLVILFPFLRRQDLDEVIDLCIEQGQAKHVNYALPFASRETVKKIYEGIKSGKLKGINEHMLFPFLDQDLRKSIFDDLVQKAHENAKDDKEDNDEENEEEI